MHNRSLKFSTKIRGDYRGGISNQPLGTIKTMFLDIRITIIYFNIRSDALRIERSRRWKTRE